MSQKLRMAKCSTANKCSGIVLAGNAIRRFTHEKGKNTTGMGSVTDRCDIR